MSLPAEVIQKIDWFATARAASRAIRHAGRLGRNINDAHRAARRVAQFATASRRAVGRISGQLALGYRAGRSGIVEGTTVGARVGRALGRASRAPSAARSFGAGAYAGLRGGENAYNRARDVGLNRSYLRGARAGVTIRNIPGAPYRSFGPRATVHRYVHRERLALANQLSSGKISMTAARARMRALDGMEGVTAGPFRDRATRARTLLEQRLVTKPTSGQRVWQSGFYERDGTWNRGRWRLIADRT